ncbi:hypothetical protein H9Y05_12250, partial [Crocinitomicaceae bacterium CZZ-1]
MVNNTDTSEPMDPMQRIDPFWHHAYDTCNSTSFRFLSTHYPVPDPGTRTYTLHHSPHVCLVGTIHTDSNHSIPA